MEAQLRENTEKVKKAEALMVQEFEWRTKAEAKLRIGVDHLRSMASAAELLPDEVAEFIKEAEEFLAIPKPAKGSDEHDDTDEKN